MFLLYDITGTQTLQLFKFFLHIHLNFYNKRLRFNNEPL